MGCKMGLRWRTIESESSVKKISIGMGFMIIATKFSLLKFSTQYQKNLNLYSRADLDISQQNTFTKSIFYCLLSERHFKIANWENWEDEKKIGEKTFLATILERKLSSLRHIYLIILSS